MEKIEFSNFGNIQTGRVIATSGEYYDNHLGDYRLDVAIYARNPHGGHNLIVAAFIGDEEYPDAFAHGDFMGLTAARGWSPKSFKKVVKHLFKRGKIATLRELNAASEKAGSTKPAVTRSLAALKEAVLNA
jgi:hypothetical protein